MSDSKPRIQVHQAGKITQADLVDDVITDEAVIRDIADELYRLVAHDPQLKLVINFEKVGFLSSAAFGLLVSVGKRIRETEGALRLCCICPSIMEGFVITRLDREFKIVGTVEEAIASF